MSLFLLAAQFLTSIPIQIKSIKEGDIAKSIVYFPFVGLVLGGILAGANNLMIVLNFNQFVLSVILAVLLIILTAGLHLDGVADTMDALLSRKPKDKMLEIMHDSHIGAMGVLSLICILLLKISLIYSISAPLKTAALILMCVLSRWCMAFSMFLFPYARREGKAKVFMQGINIKIIVLSVISVLTCAFVVWGFNGIVICALVTLCTYSIAKFINNKIGGMTGDTIGAVSEITEVSTLFFALIAGSPR